jgi:pimeloyl-ACP methyl ester carboxylesterase
MSFLTWLGSWISSNESLFSGLAAILVLAGVVFSPLVAWLRRRTRSTDAGATAHRPAQASARSGADATEPTTPAGPPARLTLQDLTKPAPVETKFARSDGVRIAYNEQGAGPHTILLAPGIFSHLHVMANLPAPRGTTEALTRFARVIAFDKRGQGLSDPTLSVPNLEERTRDIEAVMDAAGVERAVLLGFSEGGPMCLSFACAHPDRVQGLVIVGSTASWVQRPEFPIGLPRRAIEGLVEHWGDGTLRDIFFPGMSREQVDDDTYRAFERLIGNRTAIRQLVAMMIETDVRPILSGIQAPALVVHFTGDLAVPIRLGRALAEGLPNAEFLEVNAVDHADLSRSPEAIERIHAFCDRVASTAEA